MLSECEDAISDAEAFASSLSKNLSVLDGQNIHSIMGSEAQVHLFVAVFCCEVMEAHAVFEIKFLMSFPIMNSHCYKLTLAIVFNFWFDLNP